MKKIFTALSLATLFIVNSYATVVNDKDGDVLQITSGGAAYVTEGSSWESSQSTYVTRGFSIYAVGGSTVTAVTFQRFVSSMSIVQTAGISEGTTWFVYADSDKDTVGEFVNFLNDIPVLTVGCEGGIVAVIDDECYENNLTSEITVTASADINTSTNPVTVGLSNILGLIEVVDAPSSGSTYSVESFSTNVTFGTGTTYMYIRKGATSTSDIAYQQKVTTSATDESMDVPVVVGDVDTAIRFEVIGSSWISAGYFNRTLNQK